MRLTCAFCGRDINEIGQDNMSPSLDYNMCEDCFRARRPGGDSEMEDADDDPDFRACTVKVRIETIVEVIAYVGGMEDEDDISDTVHDALCEELGSKFMADVEDWEIEDVHEEAF